MSLRGIYKKENDDWDVLIQRLDNKFNHIYDINYLKQNSNLFKKLCDLEKWDDYDTKYIKNQLSCYGPVLDELFLNKKCGEFYRLLRIEEIRDIQIKKQENDFWWRHSELPYYYGIFGTGIFVFVLGTGVITLLNMSLKFLFNNK